VTSPNVPSRSPVGGVILILVIAVLAIVVLVLSFRAGRRANVEDQIRTGVSAVHRAPTVVA
jgi:hypothetical protein